MNTEKRVLRLSCAVLLCAVLLRLMTSQGLMQVVAGVVSPDIISVALFLETGRVYRPVSAPEETVAQTVPSESITPTLPPETQPQEQVAAVFSPEDAALVEVNSVCGYEANTYQLLSQTLSWNLVADAPTVLILHSHATESYENTEGYTPSANYRTQEDAYNMVSVGAYLAQALEAEGIRVIHDRAQHDYPSYSESYNQSRAAVQKYLEQYPSICLVLDLHRDSVTDAAGEQIGYTVSTPEGTAAQLMLVVGTNASGLTHPNWYENLSVAVKLHALLEKQTPGICRPISFRSQRFNQDLSTGALLIEVGAAGNTRQEALVSAQLLARAIVSMARGAVTENSIS